MDRIRVVEDCPDCHESVLEKSGIGQCACEGRQWQFQRAERGTAEEEKRLVENGFEFAKDAAGDLYYVGPFGHIIHLYPDGEWNSDKAPEDCKSLEDYFALLNQASKPWP